MTLAVKSWDVYLVSGPLDGVVSKRSAVPDQFVWVDMVSLRFCSKPGKHRHLYRITFLAERKAHRVTMEYAGHHSFCSGCQAFHEQPPERLSNCTLCGGRLVPANGGRS
jgi:hypothetical protein